ncbi:MAG: hypothetical protein AAFY72_06200 [Cyanobacteria bacterium J06649_4]
MKRPFHRIFHQIFNWASTPDSPRESNRHPHSSRSRSTTMSENQAQPSSESSLEVDQLQSLNDTDSAKVETASEQMTLAVTPESAALDEAVAKVDAQIEDMWEAVKLPGTVDAEKEGFLDERLTGEGFLDEGFTEEGAVSEVNGMQTDASVEGERTDDSFHKASSISAERENELLNLIHDLNECNDVLLARVSQLEADLENTQQTLKAESEQAKFAQNKLAEQLSTQQASAQNAAQNAQQQIAKAVDQLETTEQLLQRQHLIRETLQAELDNAQERISQLEHEAALSAQQHAAEAQARVQAETTNRDLRSRLQRQQRYTLQFKAALEKSLTVTSARNNQAQYTQNSSSYATSAGRQGGRINAMAQPFQEKTAQPTSFQDASSVTMPKAQRIMPWAAGSSTAAFEGIDPHLENLIRSASQPKPQNAERYPAPPAVHQSSETTHSTLKTEDKTGGDTGVNADPEAEAKLWQDLERVMDDAANPSETDISATNMSAAKISAAETSPKENVTVENATLISESTSENIEDSDLEDSEAATVLEATVETLGVEVEPTVEPAANHNSGENLTQSAEQKTEQTAENSEPTFNWQDSVKLPSKQPTISPIAAKLDTSDQVDNSSEELKFTEPSPWGPDSLAQNAIPRVDKQSLPTDSDTNTDTVSPVVDRLRNQKKKVSPFSSIQLPTFATAKAGSFKR